jgi:hypothetical protein
METILSIFIAVQFIFIVYSDIQNRVEREKLELKLISKGLSDYISSTEEEEESKKEEEDPYIDVMEANIDQILVSEDK